MKKPKLIKEYLEVQSFQIKEYITINGRIITKRKKIDVIVHDTYKTEDYEKLLLNKFSLKNKIINFFEKLKTCTVKFNFINILSIIIIFFIVFKSSNSIKDNLDKLHVWIKGFIKKKDLTVSNCLFLYGPPGCGKTSLAYIILNKYKYDIIELNASELRKQKDMNAKFNDILQKRNILSMFNNIHKSS